MSEVVQDLRLAARAVGDRARALRVSTDDDVTEIDALLACLEETEAQLAGARLQLLAEAQFGGADRVVHRARNTPRSTTATASASLRFARELASRFWIVADALHDGS
ncbi:MAG: hypothetical protein GX596_09600, partial [Propionibacterium sp.]|nr:hypothetical protein [Propionibacterium sp.]